MVKQITSETHLSRTHQIQLAIVLWQPTRQLELLKRKQEVPNSVWWTTSCLVIWFRSLSTKIKRETRIPPKITTTKSIWMLSIRVWITMLCKELRRTTMEPQRVKVLRVGIRDRLVMTMTTTPKVFTCLTSPITRKRGLLGVNMQPKEFRQVETIS